MTTLSTIKARKGNNMQKTIYLALGENGLVLAHFLDAVDCAEYCARGVRHTEMPFNLKNHEDEAAPLVGSIYKA